MGSIELINFLNLATRLCTVILAALTSYLLIHLDADVIRSRIYVSFNKLKVYFFVLTIGLVFYFLEALVTIASVPGSNQNDGLKGILFLLFQLAVLIFLYHLYVAIKVPDRRIL
ncbi:MAG: hypothetical protein R2741_06640 [Methanolobus sp.]